MNTGDYAAVIMRANTISGSPRDGLFGLRVAGSEDRFMVKSDSSNLVSIHERGPFLRARKGEKPMKSRLTMSVVSMFFCHFFALTLQCVSRAG